MKRALTAAGSSGIIFFFPKETFQGSDRTTLLTPLCKQPHHGTDGNRNSWRLALKNRGHKVLGSWSLLWGRGPVELALHLTAEGWPRLVKLQCFSLFFTSPCCSEERQSLRAFFLRGERSRVSLYGKVPWREGTERERLLILIRCLLWPIIPTNSTAYSIAEPLSWWAQLRRPWQPTDREKTFCWCSVIWYVQPLCSLSVSLP